MDEQEKTKNHPGVISDEADKEIPKCFLPGKQIGDNYRTGAYLFMHAVSSRILL